MIMEKDELQKELDGKKSFVLKYSQVFLVLISLSLMFCLSLLTIEGKSILRMVGEYFIRR